jgi:peptidoglycan/LPS O-acetylase OafA/YrhL
MQKTIIKVHILIFLGIFVGVYILYHTIDVSIISEVIILVLALLGIGITIEFSKIIEQTTKIRSILLYVAGCSYTIYLFHTTFEGFTKTILIKIIKGSLLDINHTTLFVFTTIVVVLSGIICPIIIHKIAKQNSKTLSYLIGEKHTGKVNDGFNKKSNENPSCQ